jgi:hypothetical protein
MLQSLSLNWCFFEKYKSWGISKAECPNPICQVIQASKFCMVAPNICEFSGWNLVDVTWWHVEFGGGIHMFGIFVHPWSRVIVLTLMAVWLFQRNLQSKMVCLISVVKIPRKLPYLALDIPERSVSWNFTMTSITLHCSIYWLHAAPVTRVWPLIIGVLLLNFTLHVLYIILCQ